MINNQRFLTRFNTYAAQNNGLVMKALTTAASVGGALIPENLEQIITDTVIRLSPELGLLTPLNTEGAKTHEFNRLNTKPAAGGAMGESATTPVTQSGSSRATVDLKIIRRKGQVTDFLKDTSRKYIDAAAWEMQNHIEAQVHDLIYYTLYGNKVSKSYVNAVAESTPANEYDGLDKLIVTNRDNQVRGGVVPTTLETIDSMVDAANRKGGAPHRRAFGMSPEMLSLFSRLETSVRKTRDLQGTNFGIIEVPGGWRLATYRDIPIIETTSTSPVETLTPTVTLTAIDDAGGTMSDGTFYVQVAPITYAGEQLACAEGTVTLSGGGAAQRIRVVLSAYHAGAIAYKIYMSTVTATEKLVKIVSAFTYDTNIAPTATATDFNGSAASPIFIQDELADASVPTGLLLDVPLVATGGVAPEIIYLWDLDPIQGLGKLPYTNQNGSAFGGLVTTEPLAKTDAWLQFLLTSELALADSFEATSVWSRGWRKA